jgi:hypothetical protein
MTLSKTYKMNFSDLYIINELPLVVPDYFLEREREKALKISRA